MTPVATARLILREFTLRDAEFFLALLNDPGWLANIADFGVRDLDAARERLERTTMASYVEHGFGLWLIEHQGQPIGTAGLISRPGLPVPDIGYALLETFTGQGFATEAVGAVLTVAHERFGLTQLCAITDPDNTRSTRLLTAHGFVEHGVRVIEPFGENRYFEWSSPDA